MRSWGSEPYEHTAYRWLSAGREGAQTSSLQSSKKINKCLLFEPALYGILLEQPKLTNTQKSELTSERWIIHKPVEGGRTPLLPAEWLEWKRLRSPSADKNVKQLEFTRCWWESKLIQALWKTVHKFLTRLNTDLPCSPEIPLLGLHPTEVPPFNPTKARTRMFIAALLVLAPNWKNSKYPSLVEPHSGTPHSNKVSTKGVD